MLRLGFLKVDEILSWLGVFWGRLILMRCLAARENALNVLNPFFSKN